MLVPLTYTKVMTSASRAMVLVLETIITHTYVGTVQTDIGSRATTLAIGMWFNSLYLCMQ